MTTVREHEPNRRDDETAQHPAVPQSAPPRFPQGAVAVMGRQHPTQRPSGYSELQWNVAERIVEGVPISRLDGTEKNSRVHQAVNRIQARLGVLTVRATAFRLLQQMVMPTPGPYDALDLDPVTRAVWEGLRWDILDVDLIPELAAALSLPEGQSLSTGAVESALARLTDEFQTTRHGLIRIGWAHHVLTPDQSTVPPVLDRVAAAPPGAGAWNLSPAHRRALALRASGRDVATCAKADATTSDTIIGRLSVCRKAAKVRTQRALVHCALRDGVLLRPAVRGGADPTPEQWLVWRHLPLDVPDDALPTAICARTGLDGTTVRGRLHDLRIRYRDDCAALYAGWKYGVLDESTPADPGSPARTVRPGGTCADSPALNGPTEGSTC
ncbi:hypothetical protein [Streptomyces sp. NBRC 110465]|uniref:hypothetical protein n=1 Tax=Streptomyces sp. NBRC 110465 TaxID=1897621 RepID=UPI0009348114|nr:hypothetical protein [Streptomyces sp. NBRC 110465]